MKFIMQNENKKNISANEINSFDFLREENRKENKKK